MTPDASQRVLGLFAKEPRAGQVKTRLAAATSPEWAARVAEAFLRDTIDRLARVEARRILAFSPPSAEPYFAGVARGRFTLVPQVGGDLGRRMAAFFAEQLQGGAEAAVLLGTDSPTVPLAFVEQAFRELTRADVVLGPATDGGYYLIGCKDAVPPIFHGIPWGSCSVLSQTVLRLKEARLACALLPPWYDIDTLADVHMLHGHLQAMRAAGVDPQIPETEKLLSA